MSQLALSERLKKFATDQDDLSRRGEKNLAAEAAHAIDSLTVERDQLAAQANCFTKIMKEIHDELDDSDSDPIPSALWDLWRKAPEQSLTDIRAKAVMHFAEVCRGAYLDGFVSAELTIYDLYQSARNHVKDNYAHESNLWDDETALTARNSLTELTAKAIENIDVVNFVSMALRHTTIKGDFNFQDVKDAFNYLATEQRQSTKEGAV